MDCHNLGHPNLHIPICIPDFMLVFFIRLKSATFAHVKFLFSGIENWKQCKHTVHVLLTSLARQNLTFLPYLRNSFFLFFSTKKGGTFQDEEKKRFHHNFFVCKIW